MTARVAIVGAGVGGLVLAAALSSRGFDVSVFEQASELRKQGTAIFGSAAWCRAGLG